MACRHHIAELIFGAVVQTFWNGTSGPNVVVFQRFQKEWDNINQTQFKTGIEDPLVSDIVGEKKDEILAFNMNQFEVFNVYPEGSNTFF